MKEKWLDISLFKGLYQISNKGRIRSLNRKIVCKNNIVQLRKGKILKPSKSSSGYLCIPLSNNGRIHNMFIQRLVMINFCPLSNYKGFEVNHIDGNKLNNYLDNLEWNTHSQNIKHSYDFLKRTSPNKGKLGILNHSSLKVLQFDLNNNLIKEWNSMADYERETGKRARDISAVINGRQKTAHGYNWKLKELTNEENTKN